MRVYAPEAWSKRERLIGIFNDSAAMPGNEPAFLKALEEYEEELLSTVEKAMGEKS